MYAMPWDDGGSYRELKKKYHGRRDVEIHHIPPTSATGIPRADGPAIAMSKADHRQLDSTRDKEYRIDLMEGVDDRGKRGMKQAFHSETADIQQRFGGRYDKAIAKAYRYGEASGFFSEKSRQSLNEERVQHSSRQVQSSSRASRGSESTGRASAPAGSGPIRTQDTSGAFGGSRRQAERGSDRKTLTASRVRQYQQSGASQKAPSASASRKR